MLRDFGFRVLGQDMGNGCIVVDLRHGDAGTVDEIGQRHLGRVEGRGQLLPGGDVAVSRPPPALARLHGQRAGHAGSYMAATSCET